jgi:four helix bundle protein
LTIGSYHDLEVWQRARTICRLVYEMTRALPKEETFGLTAQMRRAATSIPANIAEGWGRHYTAELVQFLRVANGSRAELETHLIVSADVGLCSPEAIKPILVETEILGKQLLTLERSLRSQKRS